MRQMMIILVLLAIFWMAPAAYSEDGRAIIDNVEVMSARGATAQHASIDPQHAFPDGTDRMFITFKEVTV